MVSFIDKHPALKLNFTKKNSMCISSVWRISTDCENKCKMTEVKNKSTHIPPKTVFNLFFLKNHTHRDLS